MLLVIAKKFGLPASMPSDVDLADRIMLATEKLALMGQEPAPWQELPAPLDSPKVVCHGPEKAERVFLTRFEELQGINRAGLHR